MATEHRQSRSRRSSGKPRRQRRSGTEDLRRGGGLRRLPELLNQLLDPAARRRGLVESRLLTAWPTIVGPDLAARCQPVRLGGGRDGRGGVLHLHATGGAALELQHGAPQLLERINGFFGYTAVSRIRLIQAPLPRRPEIRSMPRRELDAAERAALETGVAGISDPGLRRALLGLGQALKAATPAQAVTPDVARAD